MGFAAGDIITAINEVPTTDTQSRMEIYEKLITLPLGTTLSVSILRNQQFLQYSYVLKNLTELPVPQSTGFIGISRSPNQIEEEKIRVLKEKESFAPTYEQLRKEEKKVMLKNGNRSDARYKNVLSSSMQSDA